MTKTVHAVYDPNCTLCPRLAAYLSESHRRYPPYWSRPVAPFGDAAPRILLVGLAPGLHGANRTGRIVAQGGLDELREQVEAHVEGGREAFLARAERYGHR